MGGTQCSQAARQRQEFDRSLDLPASRMDALRLTVILRDDGAGLCRRGTATVRRAQELGAAAQTRELEKSRIAQSCTTSWGNR
jgi:hypothetical protein